MITLGIESSCDETSVALLRGAAPLASLTHSQAEHAVYGGVVPEVASRAHLERIGGLTRKVLEDCGLTPRDIDLIAVTDSPGLAGALLVGVSFALGMHAAYGIPITGVNHLEGHICSLFVGDMGEGIGEGSTAGEDIGVIRVDGRDNDDPRQSNHPTPPFLVLLASGGHTAIYNYQSSTNCVMMGHTVDDAAGEAFDKVGKLLGFPYPAGRAIEQEAAKAGRAGDDDIINYNDDGVYHNAAKNHHNNTNDHPSKIKFPTARFSSPDKSYNFSFSGLKTAVKNFVSGFGEDYIKSNRPAICRAFQEAVAESLADNLEAASRTTGIKAVAMAGGVACNGYLRGELVKRFGGGSVFFPPPSLCTDNGAMIAMAGHIMYNDGRIRFPNMDPARSL